MGILELLQVIFIILKLCGVITWSWSVVLIPVWILTGLYSIVIAFGLIGLVINIIGAIVEAVRK